MLLLQAWCCGSHILLSDREIWLIKSSSFIRSWSLDCRAPFIRIVYLSSNCCKFQFKFVFTVYWILLQAWSCIWHDVFFFLINLLQNSIYITYNAQYTKLPIHALLYNTVLRETTWQNETTFLKLLIHVYTFILS